MKTRSLCVNNANETHFKHVEYEGNTRGIRSEYAFKTPGIRVEYRFKTFRLKRLSTSKRILSVITIIK
jgi:hypothetical protein